jgi:hypothetical protein
MIEESTDSKGFKTYSYEIRLLKNLKAIGNSLGNRFMPIKKNDL